MIVQLHASSPAVAYRQASILADADGSLSVPDFAAGVLVSDGCTLVSGVLPADAKSALAVAPLDEVRWFLAQAGLDPMTGQPGRIRPRIPRDGVLPDIAISDDATVRAAALRAWDSA